MSILHIVFCSTFILIFSINISIMWKCTVNEVYMKPFSCKFWKGDFIMSRLTIKEIAKIAGVSPSAVSIVLNDKKGVSDKTRNKIKKIVEKLNYSPNPSSRRLLFNKTNNIAVLFEQQLS